MKFLLSPALQPSHLWPSRRNMLKCERCGDIGTLKHHDEVLWRPDLKQDSANTVVCLRLYWPVNLCRVSIWGVETIKNTGLHFRNLVLHCQCSWPREHMFECAEQLTGKTTPESNWFWWVALVFCLKDLWRVLLGKVDRGGGGASD